MKYDSRIYRYNYIFTLGSIGLYFEQGHMFIYYYINNNEIGQYFLRNSDINNDLLNFTHYNSVDLSLLRPLMFINDLKLNEMLQSQDTIITKMTITYILDKIKLGYLIK